MKKVYKGDIETLHGFAPDAIERKAKEYFLECDAKETRYTIAGLAEWCCLSTKDFLALSNKSPEHERAMGKIMAKMEAQLIQNGLRGKSNPVFSIFYLKNAFGYRDKSESVTTNINLGLTKVVHDQLKDKSEGELIDVLFGRRQLKLKDEYDAKEEKRRKVFGKKVKRENKERKYLEAIDGTKVPVDGD